METFVQSKTRFISKSFLITSTVKFSTENLKYVHKKSSIVSNSERREPRMEGISPSLKGEVSGTTISEILLSNLYGSGIIKDFLVSISLRFFTHV